MKIQMVCYVPAAISDCVTYQLPYQIWFLKLTEEEEFVEGKIFSSYELIYVDETNYFGTV